MQLLLQYLLFLAQAATIVVAILVVLIFIISQRRRPAATGNLIIKDITESYQSVKDIMLTSIMNSHEAKQYQKEQKKSKKLDKKQAKQQFKNKKSTSDEPTSPLTDQDVNVITPVKAISYLLSFNGSIDAHEVEDLRQEISAILTVIKPEDEVLIKLESPGGVVHGYGLAASQLMRIKERKIPLTALVDKVAASGGYMMACTADRIIAAPFAIIGSIGVVAQIPNFHRLLKKNDIDVELQTAGHYKRTLTMFGENTEEGRQKFQQELEETHLLFKNFVQENRPTVNIDEVATGEHWFALQAKEKGLVDEIRTSDDVIIDRIERNKIIAVNYRRNKKLSERVIQNIAHNVERLLFRQNKTLY